MLEQIWVIPAITFVSFWLILFFGRRLKFGGSEIGLVAVGACLLLSTVAGYQWIKHESGPIEQPGVVMTVHGESSEGAAAGEEKETIRRPVDHDIDWITIGGNDIKAST